MTSFGKLGWSLCPITFETVSKPKPPPEIRRYTTLSSAIDILTHSRLTLLDPITWDDKNDSYMVELYRNHVGAGGVTALCCSTATIETYHHWKVFTQGSEGVCIIFNQMKLEAALGEVGDLRFGPMDYKSIAQLRKSETGSLRNFAFIKRSGFRDEAEWRVIHNWRGTQGEVPPKTHNVAIPADCIKRIVVNPWMPPPLFASVKEVLTKIQPVGAKAPIQPSTLTNSSQWQSAAAGLVELYK